MAENTESNWLVDALSIGKNYVDSYFNYQSTKEQAKLQSAIETNTLNKNAQEKAQTTASNNMTKNVILVIGATLGMVLAFSVLKKALK